MSRVELAVQALRTQLQFELVQTGAAVSQATMLGERAGQQVRELLQRCGSIVRELRRAMHGTQINPALLDAMRRMYNAERQALRAAQARLEEARQREQELRDQLTALRNRDRSLERAERAEQRKEFLAEQALEIVRADDQWLQSSWRRVL